MTSLEEFKGKQLDLLHELDRVCEIAGIKYYLAYGTCLGAVRHQGYIPWDDDIDVFLPAKEMDKLMENRHLFKEQYFLQCRETDPQYQNMKYALRDSSTSYFSDEQDCDNINHGMFIDLYVLYPYPDNEIHAHKLIIDSFILRFLYLKKAPANHGMIGRIGSKVLLSLYKGEKAEKKIKRIEDDLKNNGGKKYCASFFGDDITPFSCFKFPIECFGESKRLKFEDYFAPCPTYPELICELTFGKNYMEFPPEEKRISRHHVLYMSSEISYKEFEGRYYNKAENRKA